ncbi:MAG TPA: hypothetical protein VG271_00850, partial [Beijerinckiaceae bacterium]|nr:hypothetical protein [Beijerinckiaceae bacterium]
MSDDNLPTYSADPQFLLDPYMDWAKGEGVPIHLDFAHDLLALETARWDRYDARGCFAHTHGRGDFMTNYVIEVAPGRKTRPIKHFYEAIFYTLSGYGSTTIWLPDGRKQSFEWGPKALFAIPLNCEYQIFNGSGQESARLSCTSNAPLTINLYHNLDAVFDNPLHFPDRIGKPNLFEGEGDHIEFHRGKNVAMLNVWETNFVPDLSDFKLYELDARGKASRNVYFLLANGTLHSHMSEIPVGRYKKGHRHSSGTHVHAVTGSGYSLLWYEGDSEFRRIPWRHGIMYPPPLWMFHQHFNTSAEPARYLACGLGSARYPFVAIRRGSAAGESAVSVQKGGRQIEYEDQDPRIHRKFLEEIAKTG